MKSKSAMNRELGKIQASLDRLKAAGDKEAAKGRELNYDFKKDRRMKKDLKKDIKKASKRKRK